MTLADSLCAHKDPVVAYRARRLLGGESEQSAAMRRLRRSIGASKMAQRLLLGRSTRYTCSARLDEIEDEGYRR
ncbi:MAG: hypothetical protein ACKV2T_01845 [Kofleriaceae bacterium]